ncbi:hypothetical protein ACRE_038900 [Hapsidospora chrysogenum ATCC 11550]|uniref:Uncharacterized protein n=1 Tax=Hapsidospora chrysogenum (strain ATCC 11550 / CBS 779.69 / DSM 880 / IAM 14645 / JCM 23072 / IMI 49137) TaxID=857340 RepID=A0A086T7H1_HAPC1|nr:hypothetical protein ACRE_038900 [Hapsidospora chrysogenum ATCC 11550]
MSGRNDVNFGHDFDKPVHISTPRCLDPFISHIRASTRATIAHHETVNGLSWQLQLGLCVV